ncbi:unnamed protein product [Ectocarpus sp. CCAP 1310/34]|nr:unnamed protein product [Ectocarpus sp. CCAP 1310/34]
MRKKHQVAIRAFAQERGARGWGRLRGRGGETRKKHRVAIRAFAQERGARVKHPREGCALWRKVAQGWETRRKHPTKLADHCRRRRTGGSLGQGEVHRAAMKETGR